MSVSGQIVAVPVDEELWFSLPKRLRNSIEAALSYSILDLPTTHCDVWATFGFQQQAIVATHFYRVRSGQVLDSVVTWVAPRERRKRWAQRLWRASLELQESTHVEVVVCSDEGMQLVKRLQSDFTGRVRFSVCDNREY